MRLDRPADARLFCSRRQAVRPDSSCRGRANRAASHPRMDGLDESFWGELLPRIAEGEVVPVVGPGAVTFGTANQLLYPWLAQRLPAELDPPLPMAEPPRSLQEVVDAQRAQG